MSPRVRLVLARPSTRMRFVIGSSVVHVLFAIVLVAAPGRDRDRFPDDPLVVDLVAMAPAARPAATSPPAPAVQPEAPPPAPEPEGVHTTPTLPEPRPDKKPEKKPEDRPPPRQQAAPRQVDPDAEPSESADPLPGGAGPIGEAGPAVSSVQGWDSALAWYESSVTSALTANWRKPIIEGFIDPLEVRVTFQILRNGQIASLDVEQSSGVLSLDRSALRAVSDAAPLPPLPPSWSKPTLSAGFVFRLYPE